MGENGRHGDGEGHPLPDSDEAREDELPEHLIREKGHGEDAHEPSDPSGEAVAPDGTRYALKQDQAAHQDRGQSSAEDPERG